MAAANEYVTLDIEKPEREYINLTPNFQGRVADSLSNVFIWIKRNGLPLDLTNYNVGFAGKDPDGNIYHAIGYAAYDLPGANRQAGRVAYTFPAGMFQVEGDWDSGTTYFYIDDGKGQIVSTIGVQLHVLPNQVTMGVNTVPIRNEVERQADEMRQFVQEQKDKFASVTNELTQFQNTIKTQQAQLEAFTKLIKDNDVPTKSEMESYVAAQMGVETYTGDLDDAKKAKTYLLTGAVANSPAGVTSAIVSVHGDGAGNCWQLLVDQDNNLWSRRYTTTKGWSAWSEQTAWN